jgi:hypothetical protein
MLLVEQRVRLLERLELGDLADGASSAFGARPRSRPSRASFRHFDRMKEWIASAAATVFPLQPGC